MPICTKTLTLTTGGDMPFDAAAYVPAVGARSAFIAAVRAGRIFNCDANTGLVSSQAVFDTRLQNSSCVCYDPVTDSLWAGGWGDPGSPTYDGTWFSNTRNIYKINPATLAVSQTVPLTSAVVGWNDAMYANAGLRQIFASGGLIYGVIFAWHAGSDNLANPFRFNPAAPAAITVAYGSLGFSQNTLSSGNLMWCGDYTFPRITGADMTGLGLGGVIWTDGGVDPPPVTFPLAIEWCPSNSRLYCTSQSYDTLSNGRYIYRFNIGTLLTDATIDLGGARTAFQGNHLRYNAYDGKLYAMGYGDNTVAVITPGGVDSFVVKTGFDFPLDAVFTPTKKWAVQNASVGLKEIV